MTIAPFVNANDVIVKGFIRSIVNDSIAEPLPFANMSILDRRDSAIIKSCQSGENGEFRLKFIPNSSDGYMLSASYAGLKPKDIPLIIKSDTIDVGIITLSNAIELDEVVVTGTPIELVQRGDTTIINADTYKLPEGAYLEELVRLIPGLEYDRQSKSLSYNGQHIIGIDLNGQPFFTGDNSIPMQNLPAEVIDKIKIYNKSSEIEQFIGISSNEDNYVLDLQTKKKFNGTLISSAEIGAGNEQKKLLDIISNYFKQNGDNVSLIARSDNRQLTTDYMHNLDNMAALNLNKKFNSDMSLNASVSYNGRKTGTESSGYTEEYLIENNRFRNTQSNNVNVNHSLSSFAGLNWKIDDKTMLSSILTYGYNTINTIGETKQMLFSENPILDLRNPFGSVDLIPMDIRINSINMSNSLQSSQNQFSAKGEVVRLLSSGGTNISFSASYSVNNGTSHNNSLSYTIYYQLHDSLDGDSLLNRHQYRSTPATNQLASVEAAFTYPFNTNTRLQLSYVLKSERQTNHTSTFSILPDEETKLFIDSLSSNSHSNTYGHEFALRFNHNSKIWRNEASFAVCLEHRGIDNKIGTHTADTIVNSVNYRPRISVRWQKGKSSLSIVYNGVTQQPSLTDLIVPPDYSDPLNVMRGNPSLHPAYRQSLRTEWRNTRLGITTIIEGNNEYNSQTRAIEYNPETGGRISYPVNINGNYSLRTNIRYQKRVRSFNVAAAFRGSTSRRVSLINEGRQSHPQENITKINDMASDIKLGYNPAWGGFEINGKWSLRKSVNRLRDSKAYIRDYTLGTNIFASLPYGFNVTTNLSCELRNGTFIEPHRDDKYVWNIQVSKQFLKSKSLELAVSWMDILNQRNNISISASSWGYSETYTNQIGGYFLVSVKFRFNKAL